jgi:hypothetical protein
VDTDKKEIYISVDLRFYIDVIRSIGELVQSVCAACTAK